MSNLFTTSSLLPKPPFHRQVMVPLPLRRQSHDIGRGTEWNLRAISLPRNLMQVAGVDQLVSKRRQIIKVLIERATVLFNQIQTRFKDNTWQVSGERLPRAEQHRKLMTVGIYLYQINTLDPAGPAKRINGQYFNGLRIMNHAAVYRMGIGGRAINFPARVRSYRTTALDVIRKEGLDGRNSRRELRVQREIAKQFLIGIGGWLKCIDLTMRSAPGKS